MGFMWLGLHGLLCLCLLGILLLLLMVVVMMFLKKIDGGRGVNLELLIAFELCVTHEVLHEVRLPHFLQCHDILEVLIKCPPSFLNPLWIIIAATEPTGFGERGKALLEGLE
jgi:hypothetical protein